MPRPSIKVLALDLDDTLLRSDKTLAKSTCELLDEWQARGNTIVIATGRPPRSTGESLPPSLWQVPWVCYNGAEVRHNGTVIYSDLIGAEDARAVITRLQEALPDAAVGMEINDRLFMNRANSRPYPYEVADLLSLATTPVAKVLFFHDDPASLDGSFDNLPPASRVLISHKYRLIQIMSTSADKANALRHLVAGWGMDMENVLAIGDDVNDVRMVQESGIGVAVDNAVDEVKAVADRITLSNDDGGVDLVLRELLEDAR